MNRVESPPKGKGGGVNTAPSNPPNTKAQYPHDYRLQASLSARMDCAAPISALIPRVYAVTLAQGTASQE